MQTAEIAAVVKQHLATVLKTNDFDVSDGPGPNEIDISTDDWTIHLEGAWGFLAIDDEPPEAALFQSARRAVMSEAVEVAISHADQALGGALSDALSVSGDPFTMNFVAALAGWRSL